MTKHHLDNFRCHVILCCHYMAPDVAVNRLRKLMRRWGGLEFRVYSTNERHVMAPSADVKFTYIKNKWNDFTGYIQACHELSVDQFSRREADDVYLFMNDTLLMRHPARLLMARIRKAVPTIRNTKYPILVGRGDSYRMLLQTSPFAPGLDLYISSFLFATNREGVITLNSLFTSTETRALLEAASQLKQGILPPAFHAFLLLHLNTNGSLFSWHGNRVGSGLERKAGSVLLEHLTSAEFFRNGFIAPVNYHIVLDAALWAAYRIRR